MMSSTLFDLFHGEVIRECFSESSDSTRKDSPNGIRTLRRLGRDVGSRLVRFIFFSPSRSLLHNSRLMSTGTMPCDREARRVLRVTQRCTICVP